MAMMWRLSSSGAHLADLSVPGTMKQNALLRPRGGRAPSFVSREILVQLRRFPESHLLVLPLRRAPCSLPLRRDCSYYQHGHWAISSPTTSQAMVVSPEK